ncbi:unnamed protein product [Polarella glacialis]|uniref:Uncharacterized protein n=1 Tax=Polarella glacialis TaxID=89957 RepID=A0A813KHN4_POLGL|nr:unnamed protein product [Polarella glacialis]
MLIAIQPVTQTIASRVESGVLAYISGTFLLRIFPASTRIVVVAVVVVDYVVWKAGETSLNFRQRALLGALAAASADKPQKDPTQHLRMYKCVYIVFFVQELHSSASSDRHGQGAKRVDWGA